MPLEPCRECGQNVSTEAASCPHCGVPSPNGAPMVPQRPPAPAASAGTVARGVFTGILGCAAAPFVVLFVLLILMGMCVSMS